MQIKAKKWDYLSGAFYALPQGKVHHYEDGDETKCYRPFNVA